MNDLAAAAAITVGELFADRVALHPDRVAVQSAAGNWSYAELQSQVHRYAALLQSRGIQRGDRVAILSENRREYVALLLVGACLGVTIACLNWRQSAEELSQCIQLVAPSAAFISPRFAVHHALFEPSVEKMELGAQLDSVLARYPDSAPAVCAPQLESILYILFTSGTTGRPKGACISQRALLARMAISYMDRTYRRGSTYIAWPPLFHMASADTVLSLLLSGGKAIVTDGVQVDELCEILTTEENLGWVNLMPGMIDNVLDALRECGLPLKPVDSIGALPDLLPRRQLAQATRLFGAPYRNNYGSTETGGAPGGAGFIPIGAEPESLGKQQSSLCRVRLVDPDGRDVPPGEPGELLFRGPSLFSGYWGMPEETAMALKGGWYHTGDVFVRDPDGTLRFVDRRKYLIKSGGENIYPAEIERLLVQSPRIVEASVVRKRHERWGEVPVAFVVRADPELCEEDVLNLCRGRIANYKLPREVYFIAAEAMPRSTTGKVARHLLEAVAEDRPN